MGGWAEDSYAGIQGEVGTGQVAGGVRVVDGEDAGVEGESCEVGEGEAVGGAAQGGEVEEVVYNDLDRLTDFAQHPGQSGSK